jgi:hypothetical protein
MSGMTTRPIRAADGPVEGAAGAEGDGVVGAAGDRFQPRERRWGGGGEGTGSDAVNT